MPPSRSSLRQVSTLTALPGPGDSGTRPARRSPAPEACEWCGGRFTGRVARVAGDWLTYYPVGATRNGIASELPPGFGALRRRRTVGHGEADLHTAADRLLTWQMHRRCGMRVVATTPRAEVGTSVELRLGPSAWPRIRCRVVHVVDGPRAKGFGYGTLPGHPEHGEEAFVVRLQDDGTVTAEVVAYANPAWRALRVAPPALRLTQAVAATAYLRALLV